MGRNNSFLLEGNEISKRKSLCLLSLALIPVPNVTVEILSTSSNDTCLPRKSTQILSVIFFHIQGLTSLSALHLFCPVQKHVHVFPKRYSTICGWAVTFECIPATVDETHFSYVCLSLWYQCLLWVCLLKESSKTSVFICVQFLQIPQGAAMMWMILLALGETKECHLSLFSHNFRDLGFDLDKCNSEQWIKIYSRIDLCFSNTGANPELCWIYIYLRQECNVNRGFFYNTIGMVLYA